MKTKTTKRAWSLLLALALVVTTVFSGATTAKAAEYKDYYISQSAETLTAGVEQTYPFTHEKAGDVYMDMLFAAPVDLTISLYNSAGNLVDATNNPMTVAATDTTLWQETAEGWVLQDTWTLTTGDYIYGITSATDVQFMIIISAPLEAAKISQEKATITKGFTKKLSVENGEVEKWSSSKKSIATVDSKGKVTAKKAGKAVITATLTDGTKLKCSVTVKENKYTATKLTTGDVTYGNTAMSVYNASFDKSGNLVIKARYVNKMAYKVSELRDIKVTVTDENGKKVGTYKLSKKKVSVPSGSTKDFTFTIKKANLKKKTVDLRNCEFETEGTSMYYY